MSGGNLDFVYYKLDEAIEEIESISKKKNIHQLFIEQLKLTSQALQDLDYVMSGDYGEGDEEDSILQCLNSDLLRQYLDSQRVIEKKYIFRR